MRPRREPSHKLIALDDVERLTGLEPAELLRCPDTQKLARVDERGARVELVRVPIGLLTQTSDAEPFG
jgi:hypothetical protein